MEAAQAAAVSDLGQKNTELLTLLDHLFESEHASHQLLDRLSKKNLTMFGKRTFHATHYILIFLLRVEMQ